MIKLRAMHNIYLAPPPPFFLFQDEFSVAQAGLRLYSGSWPWIPAFTFHVLGL